MLPWMQLAIISAISLGWGWSHTRNTFSELTKPNPLKVAWGEGRGGRVGSVGSARCAEASGHSPELIHRHNGRVIHALVFCLDAKLGAPPPKKTFAHSPLTCRLFSDCLMSPSAVKMMASSPSSLYATVSFSHTTSSRFRISTSGSRAYLGGGEGEETGRHDASACIPTLLVHTRQGGPFCLKPNAWPAGVHCIRVTFCHSVNAYRTTAQRL